MSNSIDSTHGNESSCNESQVSSQVSSQSDKIFPKFSLCKIVQKSTSYNSSSIILKHAWGVSGFYIRTISLTQERKILIMQSNKDVLTCFEIEKQKLIRAKFSLK